MKLIYVTLLIFSALSYSQTANVWGRISDKETKEMMPYAEILLESSENNKNQSFGVISDEKGVFYFKNLPKGDYLLKVSFVGYETFTKAIRIETKSDLGTIFLIPTTENLSEIVVEGNRSAFSYNVDKKTINASAFPEATNAIDLLTNVPSLQVSVDGKVTYREGGTFKLYINGIAVKDGQERLKMLDASQIEKIDVITNPSARYSAEGTAGIIRIVLKKNKLEGYSANISTHASTTGTHRISYHVDKKGKRGGWYSSGNYRKNYWDDRNSESLNYVENNYQLFENQQKEKFLAKFRGMVLNFGFNYDLTEHDVLDVSTDYEPLVAKMNKSSKSQVTENVFDIDKKLISSKKAQLNKLEQFTYQTISANLEYSHFFNKDKTHLLNVISGYSFYLGNNEGIVKNEMIDITKEQVFGNKNTEKNEIQTSTEINYELPLSNISSLESGMQIETDNIPEITGKNGYFSGDDIHIEPVQMPFNQIIRFRQNIYVGYVTFKSSFGKFEYKLGLRAENTDRNILYSYTKVTNRYTDPYKANFTDWFPSVHLLYSFSEDNQLMANYSRRIDRPHYSDLVPSFVWKDKYTFSTGNSRLRPSYTDSYEIGYKKSWQKDFISAEIFAKNQHDIRHNYRRTYQDDITITTYENIGKIWAIGSELMAGIDIFSWWNVNASFLGFYNIQQAQIDSIHSDFSQWRFNGKINQTFKLPHYFLFRFNTEFQSDIFGLQYDTQGYVLGSASLTKSWNENRWQVSISGWNVFDSYQQTHKSNGEKFSFRTNNIYHSYFTIAIKYQFNNQK